MSTTELLISAASPSLVIMGAIGSIWKAQLSKRDRKIELLEAQLEVKNDLILTLREHNTELKVTAQVQTHFFKQLPSTIDMIRETGT